MPNDRYTKIVLTVIAVALAVNALEKLIQPTRAENQAQAVWIAGINPDVLLRVSIQSVGGPIPVHNVP